METKSSTRTLIVQIKNYSRPRYHLFKFSLENSRKRRRDVPAPARGAIKQPGPPPTTTLFPPSQARAARCHDENEQARRKKRPKEHHLVWSSVSPGESERPGNKGRRGNTPRVNPSSFSVPFVPANGMLITPRPLSMSNAGQLTPSQF